MPGVLTYLNQGMYDVVEAARLVRVTPATILRWAGPSQRRQALVVPSLDGLYSFHDLISLHLVATLSKRELSLAEIANAIGELRMEFGTDWPLAHRELATAGTAFFARDPVHGDWVDLGKGRQQAFQEMVEPAIRTIEYGADLLASVWRPHARVWLNPRVQAGASCIDRTRIPTATIAQIVDSGDHPLDVAEDYELDPEDVIAALRFEEQLGKAA